MQVSSEQIIEFGDFQTPDALCRKVCDILVGMNITPGAIVEPTCGIGGFLRASVQAFSNCESVLGFEINPDYTKKAQRIEGASVECQDFFAKNWSATINILLEPILVIGNPPWVTNSSMGALGGTNLPIKSNFHGRKGFDALTGKSNFDISEWILLHLLALLSGRSAVLAMLCKTAVARKVIQQAWQLNFQIQQSAIYSIDAIEYFGAAVDACLLVCVLKPGAHSRECDVYANLAAYRPDSVVALHNRRLVANAHEIALYDRLYGKSSFRWRSGIKHDCSRIMELRPKGGGVYENGWGERVELEPTYLFPMLKSSELAKGKIDPSRYMLVTQRNVGEDTAKIKQIAPLTWAYLQDNGDYLDRRASSIYRKRPRFSVFGVGDYVFAPWKVAISGFYKRLDFRVVGPVNSKPVVFDDTCYFLHCQSKSDAASLAKILQSDLATGFFNLYIFWDAKRPITAEILGSLNLDVISQELGIPLPRKQSKKAKELKEADDSHQCSRYL